MPKKSNKTEHVLNLISKNEDAIEEENSEIEEEVRALGKESVEVELKKADEEEKELKIERKLKIELEPQIGIKPAPADEPELTIPVSRETMDQKAAEPEIKAPALNEVDESNWPALHPEEKRVYLINLSEKLAKDMVDEVMQRMNVCSCAMCKNDILALALNSLTHNYVTTDAGKQYMLLEVYRKQYETDVIAALTKACVRVKASPKH